MRHDVSLLTFDDLYLLGEGTHNRLYERLGAHSMTVDGVAGTLFAVWAPNAESVRVTGDFNGWDKGAHFLRSRPDSGVWEGFVPGVGPGAVYKYHVVSRLDGYSVDKADPFAVLAECPPRTGSVVWDTSYEWGDGDWMKHRRETRAASGPMSIYEMHLGSWRRVAEDGNRSLGYRELAAALADYVERMGFTHVELLPVMEHPFYGSWGYQSTGYFAPTARHGAPQDFMFLIDTLHRRGIGVILDWVPSHFTQDEHGLVYFDGTHLYEHADRRQGHHPDWDTEIFNYGRHEVRSFLLSSARYWLDRYHVDGLRVDAVASMLYLDYSRKAGEWIPNRYGGRENLEAIDFLRRFNEDVRRDFPDVVTIAEESTAWPAVSRPAWLGGLGFDMKWDMGWMHDTLAYMGRDAIHRRFHHGEANFRMMYAFTENFVLPLSHDEVVHGKGTLLSRMPGDDWQKFAGLRLLFGWMFGQPGKKLLFMGGEFGQRREWNHDTSLDWHLLGYAPHEGVARWVADLNRVYRDEPALHERDFDGRGFEWVDCNDADQSVLTFLRKGESTEDLVLVVCNFTPIPRHGYAVGVPRGGFWEEILNGDATVYGGSGLGNLGGVEASPSPAHGRPWSLRLLAPPLGAVFLRSRAPKEPPTDAEEHGLGSAGSAGSAGGHGEGSTLGTASPAEGVSDVGGSGGKEPFVERGAREGPPTGRPSSRGGRPMEERKRKGFGIRGVAGVVGALLLASCGGGGGGGGDHDGAADGLAEADGEVTAESGTDADADAEDGTVADEATATDDGGGTGLPDGWVRPRCSDALVDTCADCPGLPFACGACDVSATCVASCTDCAGTPTDCAANGTCTADTDACHSWVFCGCTAPAMECARGGDEAPICVGSCATDCPGRASNCMGRCGDASVELGCCPDLEGPEYRCGFGASASDPSLCRSSCAGCGAGYCEHPAGDAGGTFFQCTEHGCCSSGVLCPDTGACVETCADCGPEYEGVCASQGMCVTDCGRCSSASDPGRRIVPCDGFCTDVLSYQYHCGACDVACAYPSESCSAGHCCGEDPESGFPGDWCEACTCCVGWLGCDASDCSHCL